MGFKHGYDIKLDGRCEYVKNQVVVASVKNPDNPHKFEAIVKYLDDKSKDSNRSEGYQDFGRWLFVPDAKIPIEKSAEILVLLL